MSGSVASLMVVVAVAAAGCTSSGHSAARRQQSPAEASQSSRGIASCQIGDLRVDLGHGGLANTSDFAVFEIRNRGQVACAMRPVVVVTAFYRDGRRTRGVPPMRSAPASPPIVLTSGTTSLAHDADGLGILIRGGNAIGLGGCPRERVIQPWAWNVSISGRGPTLRNRTRSVAASLTACRLRGQRFNVSPQTPNSQLPIYPHPR